MEPNKTVAIASEIHLLHSGSDSLPEASENQTKYQVKTQLKSTFRTKDIRGKKPRMEKTQVTTGRSR